MTTAPASIRVVISKDGPYLVYGDVPLVRFTIGTDADGGSDKWTTGDTLSTEEQPYALCRCGKSKSKPFCDGTHQKVRFDGTETASREPYQARAKIFDGPTMQLSDAEDLCAFARFCDPHSQVWNQVKNSDDPQVRAMFIRQVGDCPAGRLVAWDKRTGQAVEAELPVSIGVVDDPVKQCGGPLWLRGGVSVVAADGWEYEVRNRVTLCRCGQSDNKPFCDGTHVAVNFRESGFAEGESK
jgi:CDGSH-type Zn-finger protein